MPIIDLQIPDKREAKTIRFNTEKVAVNLDIKCPETIFYKQHNIVIGKVELISFEIKISCIFTINYYFKYAFALKFFIIEAMMSLLKEIVAKIKIKCY